MSFGWITERINATLAKFSNSVSELKHRTEIAFQEDRQRLRDQEQRIHDLESRLSLTEASIQDLQKALAENYIRCQQGDSAQFEAMVERQVRRVVADRQLGDHRKDSAEPHVSTSTQSASRTGPLCAQCCGLIDTSAMTPVILPSFDEISRGVDPMDMSYEPLNPDEGPNQAWSQQMARLNGGSGDNSDRNATLPSSRPLTNGRSSRRAQPTNGYCPNTWS